MSSYLTDTTTIDTNRMEFVLLWGVMIDELMSAESIECSGWRLESRVPVLKNVDDVSVKDIAYKYVESTTGIVLVPSTKGGSTEI